jgi:hypothetical protein
MSMFDGTVDYATWLDIWGWHKGGIQWRWNEISASPKSKVTKIKLMDLDEHLPEGTLRLDKAKGLNRLTERLACYQGRRK